jgi:sugar O-acyltransferase (sialic acid O-acetyltransferase NeuD family)
MMKLYGVVGTGGCGREVLPLVDKQLKKHNAENNYKIVFITEDSLSPPIINNYSVMNMNEFITISTDEKYFNIAIANLKHRKRIAEQMMQSDITPFSIYAPTNINLGHNEIDIGAIFCDFTFISTNTKIGKFFHANYYSHVAHDCIIGDYVTFAPKVSCNGGVIIEEDVYVGAGAIIKQSTPNKPIIIGKGATIGMGAVVTKSISPYTTVVGNPANLLVRTELTH